MNYTKQVLCALMTDEWFKYDINKNVMAVLSKEVSSN